MISRNSSLEAIKQFVRDSLVELYRYDQFILDRNNGKGVCERAIVFRFAFYLQNSLRDNFFVDCDFNSSFYRETDPQGNLRFRERTGKPIRGTKRFIDIIIHERDFNAINDFLCFEIKKWNNNRLDDYRKDQRNLKVLTSEYGYRYGFHIIIHRERNLSQWTIYREGNIIQEGLIFEN